MAEIENIAGDAQRRWQAMPLKFRTMLLIFHHSAVGKSWPDSVIEPSYQSINGPLWSAVLRLAFSFYALLGLLSRCQHVIKNANRSASKRSGQKVKKTG